MTDPANAQIRETPQQANQGLLTHLLVVTHFVQKHAMDQLTASGRYRKLSVGYADYISRLAERDHSPGELAAGLGISKQACNKTLRELESLGLIARRPHPGDSRSRLLSLTEEGLQLLNDGVEATRAMHNQFADKVGAERLQQLIHILEKLCLRLDIELPAYQALAQGTKAGRRPTRLNILLPKLSDHLRQWLADLMSAKGYPRLRPGIGQVLGMISREGRRIQYMASILGISKQAVAATAAELEQQGYVSRAPDPEDKRQVILRLTPRGKALLSDAVTSVREVEASIETMLNRKEFRLLDDVMTALYLEVAEDYDSPSVLRNKIRQLSRQLLDELGETGARALAQQLMTLTRGKR